MILNSLTEDETRHDSNRKPQSAAMTIDRERLAALAAELHFYRGRYRNLERIPHRGLGDVLRWQLAPGRRFPKGKRYRLLRPHAHLLMHPPTAPQLTWLGHASFLFQYRGLNVLTDPVLSDRASLCFCIPIGIRRWFMAPVHVAPEEAVRIHQEIGARQSIAMHCGTFVLTDEPMDEPPRRLRQALEERGINESAFRVMQHGPARAMPPNTLKIIQ